MAFFPGSAPGSPEAQVCAENPDPSFYACLVAIACVPSWRAWLVAMMAVTSS